MTFFHQEGVVMSSEFAHAQAIQHSSLSPYGLEHFVYIPSDILEKTIVGLIPLAPKFDL